MSPDASGVDGRVPDLPTPSTRISVTEDYAAEIDELSSLKHKLGVLEPSEFADAWKQGYPYEKKMSRREYERK
ncbi:polyphosphate kinase 2, partial [Bacillus amyloliquefaciens]|nr:polyphosphate kinase 2 [Bacillus amyloliquefaciens]